MTPTRPRTVQSTRARPGQSGRGNRASIKLSLHAITLLAASYVLVCSTSPHDPRHDEIPDWLGDLIVDLEAAPVAVPAAAIYSYEYNGRVVYYLSPQCCDIQSKLYNANGIVICHPDGGVDGGGDGRCDDFLAERTDETLIWKDTRQP